MMNPPFKIAICGHIDHGKSTLIGRLLIDTGSLPDDKIEELQRIAKDFDEDSQLAYLTDQLKEERERNITIETTQIFLKSKKRSYCLIDTPGHLEFIKNMLSGTSQAEAAILIVDIAEGIKDQTRRHAFLLRFLAIPNIMIVVNKMDRRQYSHEEYQNIEKQLLSLFQSLHLPTPLIIPISAKSGENIITRSKKMTWYQGQTLINALDHIPANKEHEAHAQDLRLPIQDIYTSDQETIIVGKIAAGQIHEGQSVSILPGGARHHIKALKGFPKKPKTASAGENIGIILKNHSPAIRRGDVICSNNHHPAGIKHFRGNLIWLHLSPLREGESIQLHCATQVFRCLISKIVERIDPKTLTLITTVASSLEINQAGIIEFELLEPAIIEEHSKVPELGRFSIENEQGLLGAGTVLSHDYS